MINWTISDAEPETCAPATTSPKRVAVASHGPIIGALVAVFGMWLFLRLSDEVMDRETQVFDARIVHYLHIHGSPALHAFMTAVSQVGSGMGHTILITCVVLYLIWKSRFLPDGLTLIVAGSGDAVLNEALKRVFHRFRPEPAYYHMGYSFPSGHAMASVVVYGLLAYVLSQELEFQWRILVWTAALFMILMVGFSRVYLGVHYPTDVLGGYLAGACWLWGCILWLHTLKLRRLPRISGPVANTDTVAS